ncbi:N-succinyldiaminopimelate aminotransferase [Thermosporothrix hazakensis]|jgi:N-succinyldiaminopimelate aminotransferase|uniref:N-succinyldiaminopimelate aminotransferase n=2 Tax=Thermosporothrix TaxID=768650 RepID=A0A326U9Q9_THEHA|nr:aminotransferase class I/II-fold pyridoxal phosphate-dependent enzyme [Thermosporothrix hazakensis]PZW32821.1 N-succinyldiaminopimelate aminotransferase [Thermosporothrix hazakensis]BBH90802.1 aminotransferase [Thermosporothrix sp. COM3]GCE48852.1 aminotransferase [Thermosporothrix hazakensis]
MPTSANRVRSFATTIFTEINNLAEQHQALNLGQGKPDFDTPPDIVQHVVQALESGHLNQYAPGFGTPALCQAVADHAARFYQMDIDPRRGVVVTSGATEGLLASILGLVDPGDEVIVIEPFYDSYVPDIIMANAVPVYVPLHPPTWTIDPDELRAAFNKKTRALLLNTPHNPSGRVLTYEELSLIAQLCIEHDVLVIADEVYEHLTFDNKKHIPIASLPGMFERTVTVSSAGKLFSATGWKIGWVYGHPDLITGVWRAHQFITFSVHHPTQEAIAYALNLPDTYYQGLQTMYTAKRDLLLSSLTACGLKCAVPEGTYFVMADYRDVFEGTPVEFTRYLIEQVGVACIPPESFYSAEHASIAQGLVRFAFCKTDPVLEAVKERLSKLNG